MNDSQRRTLVALLARLPQSSTFDGRSALLTGLDCALERSESQKLVDLTLIVAGLHSLGDALLDTLVANARMFAAGTPLDRALEALAQPCPAGPSLAPLRDALAGLYLTVAEARVLCADAAVDLRATDLSGSADAFWTAILASAAAQEKLGALVASARKSYPRLGPLRDAALAAGLPNDP